jgi:hypothetical protein
LFAAACSATSIMDSGDTVRKNPAMQKYFAFSDVEK